MASGWGRMWTNVVESGLKTLIPATRLPDMGEKGAKDMRDQLLRCAVIVTVYGGGMFLGMLFLFR